VYPYISESHTTSSLVSLKKTIFEKNDVLYPIPIFGYIFALKRYMRNLIIILVLFLLSGFSKQEVSKEFVEFKRIKISNLVHFSCDNLGNIYTANTNGDIVKYDKNGVQTATVNFKTMGNIHTIDAGNPFEIYVFYKEQNKVMFFDNLLNLRGEADFEKADYFMLSAVARSFDNKIWIFDLNDLRLKKVRKDLSLELNSGNVREFAKEKSFAPSYIGDINKKVFLFDSTSGIFEFDIFGNYIRKIVLSNATQTFVSQGHIYFLKTNQVFELEQELLREKPLPIKEKPEKISAFTIASDRLVLQSGNELILYAPQKKN